MDTLLNLASLLEQMNSPSSDARSNLLTSLKPYLKPSRQEKVDQYIRLFRMTKVFEKMDLGNPEKKE